MLRSERLRRITEFARRDGSVDVSDLAEQFGVTTETIRNDLNQLQHARLLQRVHGGAVPFRTNGFQPLLAIRDESQVAEKRRIADAAVDLLPASGTIIIDSGSTPTKFAEALPRDTGLQIITNSLSAALALADTTSAAVRILGGSYNKNTAAVVDPGLVVQLSNLTVDAAFIGCHGATVDYGLTTPSADEAAVKGAIIEAAKRVVLLADNTKLGARYLARFARWDQVDTFVTDTDAEPDVIESISSRGPEVRLV